MSGRMRGQSRGEVEEFVRDRLRSILAAAAPRAGWVPERMEQSNSPEPFGEPEPFSDSKPSSDSEQAESSPDRAAAPTGRHRGGAGSGTPLRWEPARPGAVALCMIAVVAALLVSAITWWSRPQPTDIDEAGAGAALRPSAVEAVGSAEPGEPTGTVVPSDQGAAGHSGAAGHELVISVIGQVRLPGLVWVRDGARVADAIAAAGGCLPEADLTTVNLARLVIDGEQIAVGIPGISAQGAGTATPASGDLIDLNTASLAELEQLPGIGPVLGQRLVDFRVDNAGFDGVEQLREVSGIGPRVYEDIVDLVTV